MTETNVFCFRFGKAEPEWMLTAIHTHGPLTRDALRASKGRGSIRRWVPFLIERGDVVDRGGVLLCQCEECLEAADE